MPDKPAPNPSKKLLAVLDTLLLGTDQIVALLLPYIQELHPSFDLENDIETITDPGDSETTTVYLDDTITGNLLNNPDVQCILDMFVGEWEYDSYGLHLTGGDNLDVEDWFDSGKE